MIKKIIFQIEGSKAWRYFVCFLVGCVPDDYYQWTCMNCGKESEDYSKGIIKRPLKSIRNFFYSWPFVTRCEVCGKLFITFSSSICCSRDCWDKYVPF